MGWKMSEEKYFEKVYQMQNHSYSKFINNNKNEVSYFYFSYKISYINRKKNNKYNK